MQLECYQPHATKKKSKVDGSQHKKFISFKGGRSNTYCSDAKFCKFTKKVDGQNFSAEKQSNAKFKELKEKWHKYKSNDDGEELDGI